MLRTYVETTIPSYLGAYPSRDLIIAAHQRITQDWWTTAHTRFNLFISEAVLAEIQAGDSEAVSRRMNLVKDLPILELNEDVRHLTNHYSKTLGLSGKAQADIIHVAFAVSYRMDYLVTWNCSHIANGETVRRLLRINSQLDLPTPLVVTPEEILESPEG